MEQPAKLKERINSLDELRGLFSALRVLAASHVQQAQAALPAIVRFVDIIEDAIVQGAAVLPEHIPATAFLSQMSGRDLIAVCAEQGFAGALNNRVLDRAETLLGPDDRLIIIGQRGELVAHERKMPVTSSFPMASHIEGVAAVTARISENLAMTRQVDLVYAQHIRGGRYEVATKGLLPLDAVIFERNITDNPPLIQMPPEQLLEYLTGEYVYAELTHVMTQAIASENGARLKVMEAADQNIADKLNTLSREERQLRQETITSELLEIISGAEAIKEK